MRAFKCSPLHYTSSWTKLSVLSIFPEALDPIFISSTVKLGNKERLDTEQPGNSEPFPVTNLPVYVLHKDKEHLALRNNFAVTKKFLITKFD